VWRSTPNAYDAHEPDVGLLQIEGARLTLAHGAIRGDPETTGAPNGTAAITGQPEEPATALRALAADESQKHAAVADALLLGHRSSHHRAVRLTTPIGQYGQRRTFAQHGRSGLRAVAGAASASSAAASSPPRNRAPRRGRGRLRLGRGVSPLRSQAPRCPMDKAIEGHPRPLARACVWRPSLRPGDVPRSRSSRRWPVLRNRGGRPAARGSRPPRAMIARARAGAPRRVRAIAQARRASGQARP
jgi:hypothetical protein